MSGPLSFGTAAGLAELRHSQLVAWYQAPLTPSRLPQATLTPVLRRPSRLNEWSGRFRRAGCCVDAPPAVNEGRKTLGLRPWTARDCLAAVDRTPSVYGVSPALMPADPAWPARVRPWPGTPRRGRTGLWRFPRSQTRRRPCRDGQPGTAAAPRDDRFRSGIIAGSSQRGVLPGTSTPVFAMGEVSHDWLFPRLAAVVHHGGSGTTHRGVLAAVPSMAVPISFDQPYWGRRLADLGVGPPPVPYRKLTPARLARAVEQMTGNPEIPARAKQLSTVLNTEHGPAVAARTIAAALAR